MEVPQRPYQGARIMAELGLGVVFGAPTSLLSVYFAPPLMLLGAILGYEATERGDPPTRVQPVVSLTPRGASFGLAGIF